MRDLDVIYLTTRLVPLSVHLNSVGILVTTPSIGKRIHFLSDQSVTTYSRSVVSTSFCSLASIPLEGSLILIYVLFLLIISAIDFATSIDCAWLRNGDDN